MLSECVNVNVGEKNEWKVRKRQDVIWRRTVDCVFITLKLLVIIIILFICFERQK